MDLKLYHYCKKIETWIKCNFVFVLRPRGILHATSCWSLYKPYNWRTPYSCHTTVSVHIHNYNRSDMTSLNMNTLVNKFISYYSNHYKIFQSSGDKMINDIIIKMYQNEFDFTCLYELTPIWHDWDLQLVRSVVNEKLQMISCI